MDTRVQKTRQNIFQAFIELRSRKSFEEITVKELTDTAGISKQTFYLHYRDLLDLTQQIENQLITEMCQDLPTIKDILKDIGQVTVTLFQRAIAHDSVFKTIFSGSRRSSLAFGIERELKATLYNQYPELRADLTTNIYITALIHGCYNAYQQYKTIDQDKVISILGDIVHHMSEGFNTKFIN